MEQVYVNAAEEAAREINVNVPIYGIVELGGIEIWITQSLVAIWVIGFILIAFAIFVRIKLKNFKEVPKGLQNVIELAIDTFSNFSVGTTGEKLSWLSGWFFSVFLFVFFANIVGLVGVRAPTADWPLPFALALTTFVLIQAVGIKYQGMGYAKEAMKVILKYFNDNPLFDDCAIGLEVHPDNAVAIHLYKSIGFLPTGETSEDGSMEMELKRS